MGCGWPLGLSCVIVLSGVLQTSTAQLCPVDGCSGCGTDIVTCGRAHLTSFPQLPLDVQQSVKTLYLQNNEITVLTSNILVNYINLRELYLSSNQLTELPEGLFAATTQLQKLTLDTNKLTKLPEGLFSATTQLQQLELYNNQLTELPEGIFAATSQLQTLYLYFNPWHCDCNLRWVPSFLRRVIEHSTYLATCATPAILSGTTIVSLADDQLVCVAGVPQNFTITVDGPRTLTFTWDAPVGFEARGGLTGYQLSCDPQPNGFPKVYNPQEFDYRGGISTTEGGFIPSTTYNCSVIARTEDEDSVAATALATTLEDTMLFQLQITGISECLVWVNDAADAKLKDIDGGVRREVNRRCKCGFTSQHITSGEFQCLANAEEVTYRAEINGTSTVASSEIVLIIEQWIATGMATIVIQKLRLKVDSTCLPVAITSFDDPECGAQPNESGSGSNGTTPLIIGATTGTVAVLLSVITVIAVTLCLLVRRRRHTKTNRTGPRLPTPHIQPAGQPLQYELMPTRNPAYQLHDPLAEKHRGDEVGLCENEVEVYESIPYQEYSSETYENC